MLSRRKVIAASLGAAVTSAFSKVDAQAATAAKAKTKPATTHQVQMATALPSELLSGQSKQVVFYSPHPDDETLSFGFVAAELASLGYELLFVLLSQGTTTKAIDVINGIYPSPSATGFKGFHNPALEGYTPQKSEDIGRARTLEFKSAAGILGVQPNNIHVDETFETNDYTIDNVRNLITFYAGQYPLATHITMSTIDIHPQHRIAGEALRQVASQTNIKAGYVVSRTTWKKITSKASKDKSALPELHWFKPNQAVSDHAVNAALAYSAWNPAAGSFAIGLNSVPGQFESYKSERDALCLTSTLPIDDVKTWIDEIDDEGVSAQAIKGN